MKPREIFCSMPSYGLLHANREGEESMTLCGLNTKTMFNFSTIESRIECKRCLRRMEQGEAFRVRWQEQ